MDNDIKWVKYGKLLSGLIHNLNTPLMGISGRTELMQMKMGEDKSLAQIISQTDKINQMLTSAAYIVDKDNYNAPSDIEIDKLLDHYFSFINADMRFKHHITSKDFDFEPCSVHINASNLVFCLHTVMDYILGFYDDDTIFKAKCHLIDGKVVIQFGMITKDPLKADFALDKVIAEEIPEDLKQQLIITQETGTNNVSIKIVIN